MQDRRLLDLFGVRYLLQPRDNPLDQPGWRKVCDDPDPAAFDVVAGGRRTLPAYCLYESEQALPRVFVVPHAVNGRDPCDSDFRKAVLLDEMEACQPDITEPGYWSAAIVEYQPNRVKIQATGDAPGWLVLTDIWYPGWHCTVDGTPCQVHRGDYLFRAVHLQSGSHEVSFLFEPASYQWGRIVSGIAVCFLIMTFLYSAGIRKLKCSSAWRQ